MRFLTLLLSLVLLSSCSSSNQDLDENSEKALTLGSFVVIPLLSFLLGG